MALLDDHGQRPARDHELAQVRRDGDLEGLRLREQAGHRQAGVDGHDDAPSSATRPVSVTVTTTAFPSRATR